MIVLNSWVITNNGMSSTFNSLVMVDAFLSATVRCQVKTTCFHSMALDNVFEGDSINVSVACQCSHLLLCTLESSISLME